MKMKLQQLLGSTFAARAAEATDDEVVEALSVRLKLADALPEIAQALGLEKAADVAKITGTILALKQGSEQLTTLSTEMAALKAENVQGKSQKAVNEALTAYKISPAQKDWALSYAARDLEGFKAFVAAAVPMLPSKSLEILKNEKHPGGVLDEDEVSICKQLNVKPENYLAAKQAQA